jgi:hypothetical protein
LGIFSFTLDTGDVIPVDAREPVDIAMTLYDFPTANRRPGQYSVGDSIGIDASFVDRGQSTLESGDLLSVQVVEGDVKPVPTGLLHLQGFQLNAPGHVRIDANGAGMTRSIELDVQP